MSRLLGFRALSLLGALGCAFAMAFALYLEHFRGLEPCSMCIFQRVAMIAAGAVFLLGALHGPRGWGRWVYAGGAAMAASAGAGIAARHVWLQSLPPDQVPACAPSLDYLMDMLPLQEVVTMILKGEGSCAKINAAWLGLSLPAWTFVAFVGLALFALAMPPIARRAESHA